MPVPRPIVAQVGADRGKSLTLSWRAPIALAAVSHLPGWLSDCEHFAQVRTQDPERAGAKNLSTKGY
jgi:hypothetical protein